MEDVCRRGLRGELLSDPSLRAQKIAQKHNVFAQKHNHPAEEPCGQVTKVVRNEIGLST